eukprot:12431798-Heterocapsa_arctica.AAC.1
MNTAKLVSHRTGNLRRKTERPENNFWPMTRKGRRNTKQPTTFGTQKEEISKPIADARDSPLVPLTDS